MGQQKKVIIGEVPEGEKVQSQEIKKKAKKEVPKGQPAKGLSKESQPKPQTTAKKIRQGQAKKRSQRFLRLRAKVDRVKTYPLAEAIKLVQDLANAKFGEAIELHLKISGQKDKKTLPGERPGLHIKVGQVADKPEDLIKKISQALAQFPKSKIEKAVICSSMGPGIKIGLT